MSACWYFVKMENIVQPCPPSFRSTLYTSWWLSMPLFDRGHLRWRVVGQLFIRDPVLCLFFSLPFCSACSLDSLVPGVSRIQSGCPPPLIRLLVGLDPLMRSPAKQVHALVGIKSRPIILRQYYSGSSTRNTVIFSGIQPTGVPHVRFLS